MRRGALILVVLGLLAVPAGAQAWATFTPDAPPPVVTTHLVRPSGAPVGGQWQRWANESYAPGYRGTVTLDLSAHADNFYCGGAIGCSVNEGLTTSNPEIFDFPNGDRWTRRYSLLYELGHVFDYRYLTDGDRRAIMRLWHIEAHAGKPVLDRWWQGEANLTPSSKVPGEWFSDGYVICAEYRDWTKAAAATTSTAPGYPLARQRALCRMIRRFAATGSS